VTGLVSEPTPPSLASALRRVMKDPTLARRMGDAAFEFGAKLNWRDAVEQLTT
jgi:hypothetical protein